ncbi:dTDP-4-dehydrorhamnose reductase [Lysobacter sp. A03]|uniref:dTDP-4-dehydrorhamnose reductase n=1 Tax=Lysobacter sp. A03 TaxID=1199154 RepID=UPI0005B71B67|nr:dTDP-4-dehydrorhamnose reductase [Lysobacter sp. A03]KIQ97096.1 dTDP-4-dehydrorhamnose reductase [Lysobacter sp. A03]
MRLLLIGGNGQVGHELRRALAPLGDLVVTTRDGRLSDGAPCETLDLGQPESVAALVERIAPDVVINAAAYTAVDRAEDEPGLAHLVNAESPGRIAEACAHIGATLVHYSTDYVFDGQGHSPYREDDPTAPLGVYGASKLAGEQAIAGSGTQHVILRTAWVYGLHGSNFLRTMLRLAGERDELRVVADQIGSPTPAWLIADVTAALLRRGMDTSGVFHLVAAGQTSWHGFAEAIMQEAGNAGLLKLEPRVLPITTAEFPTRAARPAYSVLDTARLVEQFRLQLPDWRTALARTLQTAPGWTR